MPPKGAKRKAAVAAAAAAARARPAATVVNDENRDRSLDDDDDDDDVDVESLSADTAFLGADAIGWDGAAYNSSAEVGHLLKVMAKTAQRVVVVADASKLGNTALYRFGNLAKWSGLITDDTLGKSARGRLQRAGVHIVPANKERQTQ